MSNPAQLAVSTPWLRNHALLCSFCGNLRPDGGCIPLWYGSILSRLNFLHVPIGHATAHVDDCCWSWTHVFTDSLSFMCPLRADSLGAVRVNVGSPFGTYVFAEWVCVCKNTLLDGDPFRCAGCVGSHANSNRRRLAFDAVQYVLRLPVQYVLWRYHGVRGASRRFCVPFRPCACLQMGFCTPTAATSAFCTSLL